MNESGLLLVEVTTPGLEMFWVATAPLGAAGSDAREILRDTFGLDDEEAADTTTRVVSEADVAGHTVDDENGGRATPLWLVFLAQTSPGVVCGTMF